MKYFLLLLFFYGGSAAFGQDIFLLEGRVLNDSIEKASLNVVNVTLRKGTITNEAGIFKIQARVADTIYVSALQYESRQVIVSAPMAQKKKVAFYLIPKVNELDNVDISNIDLSGDITKDTETIKADSILQKIRGIPENTAPVRSREERLLYEATTRGADVVGNDNLRFDIPLQGIINAISGKTKRLKKLVKVTNLQKQVDAMRYRFSDSLFILDLHIQKELIDDFMMYLYQVDDSLQVKDDYNSLKMIDLMKLRAPSYMKLRASEHKKDTINVYKN